MKMRLAPVFVLLCIVLCAGIPAFAQSGDAAAPLACGSKVFVIGTEDVSVTLEGQLLGMAPILVDLGSRKAARLEFIGSGGSGFIDLEPDSRIGGLTFVEARLVPATGILSLQTTRKDLSLLVDDAIFMMDDASSLKLAPGKHVITIHGKDLATTRSTVDIQAGTTTSLAVGEKPGYPLVFARDPGPDSFVDVLADDGSLVTAFRYGEPFLLPAGTSRFVLHIPHAFMSWEFTADPLQTAASPVDFDAALAGTAVPVGTNRKVNMLVRGQGALQISAGDKGVQAGSGFLAIRLEDGGIAAGSDIVVLEPGALLDTSLLYRPSLDFGLPGGSKGKPVAEIKKDPAAFWTFMISGAMVLVGSLMFNNDSLLFSITDDYSTYSAIKYATMGGSGLGAALMLTSLFF